MGEILHVLTTTVYCMGDTLCDGYYRFLLANVAPTETRQFSVLWSMGKARWSTSCGCPTSWRGGMPLRRMRGRRRYMRRTQMCFSAVRRCFSSGMDVLRRSLICVLSSGPRHWNSQEVSVWQETTRCCCRWGKPVKKYILSGQFEHHLQVIKTTRFKYCCVCRDAQMIMEDIKRAVSELEQESSLPAVGVELVDNELATLYMNSKRSEVIVLHLTQSQTGWGS